MKRASAQRRLEERAQRTPTKRTLTVGIERIVPGGMGIGHAERMTVLVPFTAPNDTVSVGIDRVRGNTAFASVIEVLEPSADRAEPSCPHFGICGGCDLQHLTYEAQLAAKQEMIKDCFRRIGGIELDEVSIMASPKQLGYRIRADWAVDPDARTMGYFRRATHEVLDIDTCPILDPALEQARLQLKAEISEGRYAPGKSVDGATAGGEVGISPKSESFPAGLLTAEIAGERIGFDASCFFQSNGGIVGPLVEHVIAEASQEPIDLAGEAVDLYCGVGLFTISLARRFGHVIGVESQSKSGSYAHENARAAGLTNVTISGLTAEAMAEAARRPGRDAERHRYGPAAAGSRAGDDRRAAVHGLETTRLCLVRSGHAGARSQGARRGWGTSFADLQAFDMFPQTHHVECVATLARSSEG